jgi:3-dehydroquinate synthase
MPTARVKVTLPPDGVDRSYEILIRDGILKEIGSGKVPLPAASSYFIVTDSNVARLYGKKLLGALSRLGSKAGIITFPAGEASKNIGTASTIATKLNEHGADRASVVLALGGGVVGDLAGFVASIYKRGIGYVQLPTTLLAQVDSSIGGKTGVDMPWGKNQLGTFYQPEAVLTDPLTLRTLPPEEITNGLAEIIKCAIIADRKMFTRLSNLKRFDSEVPMAFIVDACKIKARVVAKDEKESNLRVILNFGHTVGHAIESSSGYALSHGKCVILGMIAESWIAHRMGVIQKGDFEEISELLHRFSGHFVVKPDILNETTLVAFARADKKALSSSLLMSLPMGVGKMHASDDGSYKIPVEEKTFRESIRYVREAL